MPSQSEPLLVHVNVEVSPEALSAIVETVKRRTGRNHKGHYRVDTAAAVGEMVSKFLKEKDFTAYVKAEKNYP